MSFILLYGLLLSQSSISENWSFQPELSLRYLERAEEEADLQDLQLGAGLAGFYQDQNWRAGLGARSSDKEAISIGRISLGEGASDKNLSIHLAFLERSISLSRQWTIRLIGGKFFSPVEWSPLLWDSRRSPEGFSQELEWKSRSGKQSFRWSLGQWILAPQRPSLESNQVALRSWSFVQAFRFRQGLGDFTDLTLDAQGMWQLKSSSAFAEDAQRRGNSVESSDIIAAQFTEKFAPLEASLGIVSTPYGVLTRFKGSFAWNPRSRGNDRAFFVESQIGRPWTSSKILFSMGFFSIESDLQIASLVDRDWAGTNRRGVRGALAYFPTERLMLQLNYLWADPIRDSSFQGKRQEWIVGTEYRF
jgi:hypothetical protein